MEVFVENTGSLGRRLKVSVPASQLNEQVRTKMTELGKQAHIKGFRPGKVPSTVLQKRFGKSIRAEAIGEMIQSSLETALKDNALEPAGSPMIEEVKEGEGKPLEYIATFEVFPNIQLADLSDVEVTKKVVAINDKDIQSTIEKMCQDMAAWVAVDRVAKLGDKLTIDLERSWTEGEPETQKFEQVPFELDGKKSLETLVSVLVGKKAGDLVEETLAYPDTWYDEKFKGKKAAFKVKVHEVLEKQPLTVEQLTEKVGLESADLDGLKAAVKERLEKEAEKVLREELKESVLEILLEKNPVEKPTSLLEHEKKTILKEVELEHQRAHSQPGHVHNDDDKMSDEELNELAEKRVVLGLLVNEVIKLNNIKVNNQRVRETIGEHAANFPDPKRFINYYYNNKGLMNGIERLVLLEQVVEKILEGVKVVEKPVTFDEVMKAPDQE